MPLAWNSEDCSSYFVSWNLLLKSISEIIMMRINVNILVNSLIRLLLNDFVGFFQVNLYILKKIVRMITKSMDELSIKKSFANWKSTGSLEDRIFDEQSEWPSLVTESIFEQICQ